MAYDPSAIWAAISGGYTKGTNFLAGNGAVENNWLNRAENMKGVQNLSDSFGRMNEKLAGHDEFNRQINSDASNRYANLAQMYPELWQAKRKARYQSGALSALGGT
jgi:hypothetical protein